VTSKAEAELRRGINSYEDAEYELAAQEIQSALDRGLKTRADKAKAYKYLAFVACTSGRLRPCHAAFRNALEVDPKFDLAPAEAGHPIWGPVFRDAKLEVKGKVTKR
jgi:Tfp pilus assembly protein PilF